MQFPYPFTISAEAACDIVSHGFKNPDRKFLRAEIVQNSEHGEMLKMYYTVPSLEAIGEKIDHLYIEMPIKHVITLMTFALDNIKTSLELTGIDPTV